MSSTNGNTRSNGNTFPKLEWQAALTASILSGELAGRAGSVARYGTVGMFLSQFMDDTGFGFCPVEKLRLLVVKDDGQPVSEKTVDRALKWLAENGWMLPSAGRTMPGKAKEYQLTLPTERGTGSVENAGHVGPITRDTKAPITRDTAVPSLMPLAETTAKVSMAAVAIGHMDGTPAVPHSRKTVGDGLTFWERHGFGDES